YTMAWRHQRLAIAPELPGAIDLFTDRRTDQRRVRRPAHITASLFHGLSSSSGIGMRAWRGLNGIYRGSWAPTRSRVVPQREETRACASPIFCEYDDPPGCGRRDPRRAGFL